MSWINTLDIYCVLYPEEDGAKRHKLKGKERDVHFVQCGFTCEMINVLSCCPIEVDQTARYAPTTCSCIQKRHDAKWYVSW